MTCKRWREILAEWIEPAPRIPAIYLFGSRVRADHKPNSDIDVCLYLNEWNACDATIQWWAEQNASDFQAVKARLPRPLAAKRMTRPIRKFATASPIRCLWWIGFFAFVPESAMEGVDRQLTDQS
jgi:predicted nucleotidyltransferase